MSKGTKWLIATLISGVAVFIATISFAVEPKPNTIVQHPVENIDFVRSEGNDPDEVFIKSDRENFIVSTSNINFIQAPNGADLLLDEVKYASPRSAFGVRPYNLHLPVDQIKTINEAYLKTFGEEIPFSEDENGASSN